MTVPPDKLGALRDAVRLLAELRIPHALIGGVAVGVHSAVPRATLDTDLAIDSSADREAVVRAFVPRGFLLDGRHEHSVNLRHASGEPVQLAADPGFDPMIARAGTLDLDGVAIPIVTRADLIAMKERAAADPARCPAWRLGDRADLALLRGDVAGADEGW